MRRGLILTLLVAGFLILFLSIALRRQAPDIPVDDLHAPLLAGPSRDCMTCHGPSGDQPRGPNHPLGEQCRDCHFITGEAR